MFIYILLGMIAGLCGGLISMYAGIYLPYVGLPLIGVSGFVASIIDNRMNKGQGTPLPI